MSPILDLQNADTTAFEPLPSGQYQAEIFEITMDETSNPEGKVPQGTPLMKIRYRVTDEPFVNRALYQQLTIPPANHPKDKRDFMLGLVARFFIALGEDESVVKSGNFDPDLESYRGRPITVVVGQKKYNDSMQNIVTNVKAAGDHVAGGLL